jgi:dihydrofolate reductase
MTGPRISLVVAVSENGVIGRAGGLPWRLRSDLRAFRKLTLGHAVIMGRKTFESLPAPLDKRDMIVVTRQPATAPNAIRAASLEDALDAARSIAVGRGQADIFVIGGAEIFAAAIPLADRIHLTRVHAHIEGDVFLPELAAEDWTQTVLSHYPRTDSDEFPHTLMLLERKAL